MHEYGAAARVGRDRGAASEGENVPGDQSLPHALARDQSALTALEADLGNSSPRSFGILPHLCES